MDLLNKEDNSFDADNVVTTIIQKCNEKDDLSSSTVKELF